MTIDAESSANRPSNSRVSSPAIPRPRQAPDDQEPGGLPMFLGGWQAYQHFVPSPPDTKPAPVVTHDETPDDDVTELPRKGLKSKLFRRFEVYRVNRAFRRRQREFEQAMDCIAHDPGGQQELRTSWTLRD